MSGAGHSLRRAGVWTLALAGLVAMAISGSRMALAEEERVRILIDSPAPGVQVESQVHQARISGNAVAEGDEPLVLRRHAGHRRLRLDPSRERRRRGRRRGRRSESTPGASPSHRVFRGDAQLRSRRLDPPRRGRGGPSAHRKTGRAPGARGRDLLRGRGRPDDGEAQASRPAGRVGRCAPDLGSRADSPYPRRDPRPRRARCHQLRGGRAPRHPGALRSERRPEPAAAGREEGDPLPHRRCSDPSERSRQPDRPRRQRGRGARGPGRPSRGNHHQHLRPRAGSPHLSPRS